MMKRLLLSIAIAQITAVPFSLACEGKNKSVQTTDIQSIKKASPTLVDVNSPSTREKFGIIPGAILLSSPEKFVPEKELPTAKEANLVFYCSNTQCGASKKAAIRAQKAGYKNVAVLPVGIKGWIDAGEKTEKLVQKS